MPTKATNVIPNQKSQRGAKPPAPEIGDSVGRTVGLEVGDASLRGFTSFANRINADAQRSREQVLSADAIAAPNSSFR